MIAGSPPSVKEGILRAEFDGPWLAADFTSWLASLESAYNFIRSLWLLADSPEAAGHYARISVAAAVESMRLGPADHPLELREVSYSSPGWLDLAGVVSVLQLTATCFWRWRERSDRRSETEHATMVAIIKEENRDRLRLLDRHLARELALLDRAEESVRHRYVEEALKRLADDLLTTARDPRITSVRIEELPPHEPQPESRRPDAASSTNDWEPIRADLADEVEEVFGGGSLGGYYRRKWLNTAALSARSRDDFEAAIDRFLVGEFGAHTLDHETVRRRSERLYKRLKESLRKHGRE